MPGPHFQILPWAPAHWVGVEYPLDHLDEYEFSIVDSAKIERRIAVSFSDHVFTRDATPTDDAARAFPGSSRVPPGFFCPSRYKHSLQIRALIAWGIRGESWYLASNENYAQLPTVDEAGKPMLYAIVFSLDRVKGLDVDLHMRIRSAFPCDRAVPATFGAISFKHLVRLRSEHKRPVKNLSSQRRKPSVGRIAL